MVHGKQMNDKMEYLLVTDFVLKRNFFQKIGFIDRINLIFKQLMEFLTLFPITINVIFNGFTSLMSHPCF